MSEPQVSFLMPAHNEERVIHHALDGLQQIAGPAIEVLVGLDGCTDGTGAVVGRYDFARVVEMDERGGKPAVLCRLMDLARGRIVAIHDADWRLVCDRKGLEQLVRAFDDPQVGGIILPPHNIPFWELRAGIQSPGFVGAGLGVLLLWEHLLRTQTRQTGAGREADPARIVYPFTVNVLRRGAIPLATTAADDFERFFYLLDAGYRVTVFNDPALPYFQITDQELSFRDHLRQRVKNHLARAQLARAARFEAGVRNFQLPFVWYCVQNARRLGWRDAALVFTWYTTIILALLRAWPILRRGVPDAREAWEYRITRHV
ncbi:MAG: glycosyltransferase [Chloroflexi bacterium]|nr:glycosyltransferase [Chloroflexota bacterium]MBU1748884.1 glycosyltransferase [Chloroflexota bacterium]